MSYLERILRAIIIGEGLPLPEMEYRFDSKRRWKFDMCWRYQKLAVEVEGGIWVNGRHNRGKGFLGDCEKYNAAALAGYRVIRICKEHIDNGQAILWIKEGLGLENND